MPAKSRRLALPLAAALLIGASGLAWAQCSVPILICSPDSNCLPIVTSFPAVTEEPMLYDGFYTGSKCGTKWCWRLRCACGARLGTDICEYSGIERSTSGPTCSALNRQFEPAVLNAALLKMLPESAPQSLPQLASPSLEAFPAAFAADASDTEALRLRAAALARLNSFDLVAKVYIQVDEGEEFPLGSFRLVSAGERWKLESRVDATARRTLPLDLQTDVSAFFDGQSHGIYLAENETLSLQARPFEQLPTALPNPLALILGVVAPGVGIQELAGPSVAFVQEYIEALDWAEARSDIVPTASSKRLLFAGPPMGGSPTTIAILARRAGLELQATTLARSGQELERTTIQYSSEEPSELPAVIVVEGRDEGRHLRLRYSLAWDPSPSIDSSTFALSTDQHPRIVIDADVAQFLEHPQLAR